MELLGGFSQGFYLATQPLNLGLIIAGSFIGMLIGILPGIRSIHGIAILLPISYAIALPVESVLIFLVSAYSGAIYNGRVSDILCCPKPKQAEDISVLLTLTNISSFVGGLIAISGLIFSVSLLRILMIPFGPAEYFALVIFALASLTIRAGRYPARTLISTCIGLMMATIGIDSTTGVLRFTLGEPQLYDGIEFTTVVIGLFAISEAFVLLERETCKASTLRPVKGLGLKAKDIFFCKWTFIRASLAGFLVGLLPGAGTSIASSFSNEIENRLVCDDLSTKEKLLKTIVAEETANNAAAGGAMVPMLALGIPGSGTTAILLGALLLYNITPGPGLFQHHADMIWAIISSMCIGSVILLCLNLLLARTFTKIYQTPNWLFVPCFIVLAFIGGFAVNASNLSLLLLILLGGFGYLLKKLEYPLVPLLLGFVLGELMEDNLRRALAISGGEIDILFASPISICLWGMALVVILLPLIWQQRYGNQ